MKKIVFVFCIMVIALGCEPSDDKAKTTKQLPKETIISIPGLTAVDVYGNFTDKGFLLTKNLNTASSSWTVKQKTDEYEFEVIVYGKGPSNITTVEATALNFSSKDTGQLAKSFLAYVASIPYDGASPANAKEWVESNINKTSSVTFGNAEFEITANPDSPKARMLTISAIAK